MRTGRREALGVEIVGIAVDNAAKVTEFQKTYPISYPLLLSQADRLELMRRLGNSSGGLPYTVIFGRGGGSPTASSVP